MSEKINATCKICGKGYHLCASCKNIMDLNPWRKHTDTSEHYKIYQIIRGYSIKLYNKEEAKQKLQNVDLSDLHELKKNIQEIIKEIMYLLVVVHLLDQVVVVVIVHLIHRVVEVVDLLIGVVKYENY